MRFSKYRLLFLISITVLLFSTVKYIHTNNRIDPGSILQLNLFDLEEHEPITISTNEDFLSFPGSGTLEDPYLFENYNITSDYPFGIRISSTTKHFLIKNCFIDVTLTGILIEDIFEGSVRIENNIITDSDYENGKGVVIYFATEVVLEENVICNHKTYGLVIAGANACYIVRNSFSNNGKTGMATAYVNILGIFENECNENENGGMYVFESDLAIIKENDCSSNGEEGLLLEQIEGCVVQNNTIERNRIWGMRMKGAEGSLLNYNLFRDNEERGLYLDENSNRNWIYQNDFINSSRTGYSQGKDEGEENRWCDEFMKTGNFWDDLGDELEYTLDGDSNSVDLYPLRQGNVIQTQLINETNLLSIPCTIGFMLIVFVLTVKKKIPQPLFSTLL